MATIIYDLNKQYKRSDFSDLSFRNKTVLFDTEGADLFSLLVFFQFYKNKNIKNKYFFIENKYSFFIDAFNDNRVICIENVNKELLYNQYDVVINLNNVKITKYNIIKLKDIFFNDKKILTIYPLKLQVNSLYSNLVGINIFNSIQDKENFTKELIIFIEYLIKCSLNTKIIYNNLSDSELNIKQNQNTEIYNEQETDIIITKIGYENHQYLFHIIKLLKNLRLFIGKENELFLFTSMILSINKTILIHKDSLQWINKVFKINNILDCNNLDLLTLELEKFIKSINTYEIDKFYEN